MLNLYQIVGIVGASRDYSDQTAQIPQTSDMCFEMVLLMGVTTFGCLGSRQNLSSINAHISSLI